MFYDGTTDQNPATVWRDGGRVKLGTEIVGFDRGLHPGDGEADVDTAEVEVPADLHNIFVDGTRGYRQFRVGEEVVEVITRTAGVNGTVTAIQAGDDQITVGGNWNDYATPPAGERFYLKIGADATAEWVSYSGVTRTADGVLTLTGVDRGRLDTAPRDHANERAYRLPPQFIVKRGSFATEAAAVPIGTRLKPVGVFTNVVRGVAGTNAAAHGPNTDIKAFATDDALRETAAHEFGHAIGMGAFHTHRANSIMQESTSRGAFLGNGSYDAFLAASQDEIDAR